LKRKSSTAANSKPSSMICRRSSRCLTGSVMSHPRVKNCIKLVIVVLLVNNSVQYKWGMRVFIDNVEHSTTDDYSVHEVRLSI
jgi:hypothetical protein